MYSVADDAALPAPGFPIRRSAGQRLFSASPRLIAAVHVLPRLLVPRHPPCALTILTVSSFRARRRGRCYTPPRANARTTQIPLFGLCAVFKLRRGRRTEVFRPRSLKTEQRSAGARPSTRLNRHQRHVRSTLGKCLPRKEVIQPQLPLRLPCYDFTPITGPTFDGCLPKRVSSPASGVARFRGVTGGVYKARERIHRGVADPRLLATPTSWRRVSASNPNQDALFGIGSTSRYCIPLCAPM